MSGDDFDLDLEDLDLEDLVDNDSEDAIDAKKPRASGVLISDRMNIASVETAFYNVVRGSSLSQGGEHLDLTTKQTILFSDSDSIWFVESGTLILQSSRFSEGQPVGERRHLFELRRGLAVFGSSPHSSTGNQAWLGLATEDTVLRKISFASFVAELIVGDVVSDYMLECWSSLLGRFVGEHRSPPVDLIRISDKGEYEFGREESFAAAPETYFWVGLDAGKLAVFNEERSAFTAEDGFFLAGGGIWFEVLSEEAEIDMRKGMTLTEGAVKSGISALHRYVADYLDQLFLGEEQEEALRRKNSYSMRQVESKDAVRKLSQVLQPFDSFAARDTALLTAMSVIGTMHGFSVEPPAASEDLSRVNDPIEAIARASRIRYRKILLQSKWWIHDNGPFIAFVGESRTPVAILPTGTGYEYVDPERRLREPLLDEVRDELNHDAYILYRPMPDKMDGLIDFARFIAKGKGRDFLFILSLALVTTLLGMIGPRITGTLVDTAIPAADASFLAQLSLILIVAGLGAAVFAYVQSMTMVRTSTRTEDTAQTAIWDRLLRASPQFFRSFASGELQHRVAAVGDISRELNTATLRPLFSGVMALMNWLLLWSYSPKLAVMAIYVGLVVTVITVFVGFSIRTLSRKLYDVEGDLSGLVIQLIGGVSKIRVAGAEQRAFNAWMNHYTEDLKLKLQIQKWKDAIDVFNAVLMPTATALLFWKAVELTIELPFGSPDRISIGDFVAFNAAFVLYLMGWQDLSNGVVDVMDAGAKLHRVRPLLDEPPEVLENASDPGRLSGHIALENLSFRYKKDGPLILDRVSFELHEGEYVAFVGPSGSGKSTILRMLLGFETTDDGRVLYDGKDMSGMDTLAIRRQIGTVLQAGRLNASSILNNIKNNAKATLGEIWEAVADAGMTEDLEAMPMGLHTMVSEGGGNLSGGQRQRLLIARAMVLRPKIFFFDEATSALDNRTQAIVSASLSRRKCTRIVIAHRLSTIRAADRIFVVDAGRIVQVGAFDELAAQEGLFKRLMARQMV